MLTAHHYGIVPARVGIGQLSSGLEVQFCLTHCSCIRERFRPELRFKANIRASDSDSLYLAFELGRSLTVVLAAQRWSRSERYGAPPCAHVLLLCTARLQ